jgi:hypothetical protein
MHVFRKNDQEPYPISSELVISYLLIAKCTTLVVTLVNYILNTYDSDKCQF